jgi:gas vesicle protein
MAENQERGVMFNFLAGVGMGAIVGAAVALLMAPKSGSETREDLKKAVQDLSKSTEDLKRRSSELIDTAKSKVQQAYETGRETLQKKQAGEESGEATSEA